jgi:large subunit ribosomal protein L31e
MVNEKKEEAEDVEAEEKTEEVSEEPIEDVEELKTEEAEREQTEEEMPEETAEVTEEEQKEPTEEEEVEKPKGKKTEEEDIVEEKFYTVPLGKAWITPPRKRAPRAIRMLKAFITKHMKLESRKETEEEEEESRLVISNEVNLRIWNRGIEKPPRKIRVRAAKDKEGTVTVYLAEGE